MTSASSAAVWRQLQQEGEDVAFVAVFVAMKTPLPGSGFDVFWPSNGNLDMHGSGAAGI